MMSRKNKEEYNEYMRIYMLNRYWSFKSDMIARLGGKCVKCGAVSDLEIHHINPAEKEFTLTVAWNQKPEVIAKELAKCELRCGVHHKEFHSAKHGNERKYRSGCRCEICIAGYRKRLPLRIDTKRRWREKKRQT